MGYLGLIVELLPEAAVAPILVFIGLEITSQAFYSIPKEHYKAVALAFIPIIASLVLIELNGLLSHLGKLLHDLSGAMKETYETVVIIANGFIISSLLWGAALAMIIDHRLKKAAVFLMIGCILTLFGIIHSPFQDGRLFFPWDQAPHTTFSLSAAYGMMAIFLIMMDGYRNRNGMGPRLES